MRVSGCKADKIITSLGIQKLDRVEVVGYSGGIWLGWKEEVMVEVIHNHPQFFTTRIHKRSHSQVVIIVFVY